MQLVPLEPIVAQIAALLWLFQELVGNWKSGKRLTQSEKALLIRYLWIPFQQHETHCNHHNAKVLIPLVHTFSQNNIGSNAFYDTRHTIPHRIDEHDIPLCEASDEEEYDTNISSETADQIAQLVAACKEFQLKVPENFSEAESQ